MRPVIRLAILVSHPIQYFAPVYRALAKRNDVELTVLFHCQAGTQATFDIGFGQSVQWDVPLLDGYPHQFLSSGNHTGGLQLSVINTLRQLQPDILIIHGYGNPTDLVALAACKLLRIKTLLRGDTRLFNRHKLQSHLVRWLKARLLRMYDGFLTIGSLNREYYLAYGVESRRMHHAPFCVDNSAFVQSTLNSRLLRKEKRQALGIDEKDIVVLFASKLTHRKRATDLLSAFSKLVRDCPSLWVVVAGAGEEGDKLRQQARAAGLEEKVKFVGFINQSGLPALYAMSDVFALPAEDEPWGLVINEVMAAGLPVIVSNGVGAAADLVQGQGTGIIYPMGDVAALADSIARLVKDADLRRNMGVRASALIARWDVEACVEGIARAIRKIRPSMECS